MLTLCLCILVFLLVIVNIKYYKPQIIFYYLPDNHIRIDLQYNICSYWEDNNKNKIPTKERVTKMLFIL